MIKDVIKKNEIGQKNEDFIQHPAAGCCEDR
jgi:hypothetical protein